MNRSFASVLAAAAAGLVLAACGGSDASESAYFQRLDQAEIDTNDRDSLIEVGTQTCDKIRADVGDGNTTTPGEVMGQFLAGETFPTEEGGYGDGVTALTITLASAITVCEDTMDDDQIDKNWQDFLDGRQGLVEYIGQ